MPSQWLKLYGTFSSHYKIAKLSRSIDPTPIDEETRRLVMVQGMMARLWSWCLSRTAYERKTSFRPGRVTNGYIFTESKIPEAEFASGWGGEPGGFVKACVECGLIDEIPGENGEKTYQIHNWDKYAGAMLEAMRKREERENASKTVQDGPGQSGTVRDPLISSYLISSSKLVDSVNTKNSSNTSSSSPDMPKPLPRLDMDEQVQAIFQHYKTHHPGSSVARLQVLSDEYRCIASMLESGFSVGDCCKAIDGYHNSAFHMGANSNNQKYLSLTLIFQDVSHVQKGVEMSASKLESSLLTADEVKEKLKREALRLRVEEKKARRLTNG